MHMACMTWPATDKELRNQELEHGSDQGGRHFKGTWRWGQAVCRPAAHAHRAPHPPSNTSTAALPAHGAATALQTHAGQSNNLLLQVSCSRNPLRSAHATAARSDKSPAQRGTIITAGAALPAPHVKCALLASLAHVSRCSVSYIWIFRLAALPSNDSAGELTTALHTPADSNVANKIPSSAPLGAHGSTCAQAIPD